MHEKANSARSNLTKLLQMQRGSKEAIGSEIESTED